jgi:hypothetical protein
VLHFHPHYDMRTVVKSSRAFTPAACVVGPGGWELLWEKCVVHVMLDGRLRETVSGELGSFFVLCRVC